MFFFLLTHPFTTFTSLICFKITDWKGEYRFCQWYNINKYSFWFFNSYGFFFLQTATGSVFTMTWHPESNVSELISQVVSEWGKGEYRFCQWYNINKYSFWFFNSYGFFFLQTATGSVFTMTWHPESNVSELISQLVSEWGKGWFIDMLRS